MLNERDQVMTALVTITFFMIASWMIMDTVTDFLPRRWANSLRCVYMAAGGGIYAMILTFATIGAVVTTSGLICFLIGTATAGIFSGVIAYFTQTEGGKTQ